MKFPHRLFQTSGVTVLLLLVATASSWAQLGDFDGDGDWDGGDINRLTAEIVTGTNNVAFDLNADSLVDAADANEWLALAGAQNLVSGQPFLPADSNLDGDVDVSDFMIWNGNVFTASSNWTSANHNFDRFVDVSDFNIWNEYRFMSSGPLINNDLTPQPLDGAVDFIYDASTGVMSVDSNTLEIWCFSVFGVEPEEFLLNGGGDVDPDESIWVQDFFRGHSKWFSLDQTSVGDGAIALFATGLTADDFGDVSFGSLDNLTGRGSVTIVNAPVTVPEPSTVVLMLPLFVCGVICRTKARI